MTMNTPQPDTKSTEPTEIAPQNIADMADPPAYAPAGSAAQQAAPEGQDGEAPSKPHFVGEDKRAAFYARMREKAAERAAKPADGEPDVDPTAPFATSEAEAFNSAGQDQPAADQGAPAQDGAPPAQDQGKAPEPKVYNLTVNGNTFQATREQLLRMADVSEDEAADLPDTALVRSAQMLEAARQRLAAAKQVPAPQGRGGPSATPAEYGDDPTADLTSQAPQGTPTLSEKELMQKIQFGSEDEALEAHRELTRRELSRNEQTMRLQQAQRDIEQALSEFSTKYSDVWNDPVANEVATATAAASMRNAILATGRVADPQAVAAASQEEVIRTYFQLQSLGWQLPPVSGILEETGRFARERLRLPGQPAAQPQPGQQPQLSARDQRIEAKRALVQTPQRAGPPASNTPARPASREEAQRSVINRMREARFQRPIP